MVCARKLTHRSSEWIDKNAIILYNRGDFGASAVVIAEKAPGACELPTQVEYQVRNTAQNTHYSAPPPHDMANP